MTSAEPAAPAFRVDDVQILTGFSDYGKRVLISMTHVPSGLQVQDESDAVPEPVLRNRLLNDLRRMVTGETATAGWCK